MQIRVVVRETTIRLVLAVKITLLLLCSSAPHLDGFPHEAVAGLVRAGEV